MVIFKSTLLTNNNVVVFGLRRCVFTQNLVKALRKEGVKFKSFYFGNVNTPRSKIVRETYQHITFPIMILVPYKTPITSHLINQRPKGTIIVGGFTDFIQKFNIPSNI